MFKIYFGSPGCGKTTLACRQFYKEIRKGPKSAYKYLYANFETKLANEIDLEGLGTWSPPEGSLLVVDEAGIVYNSRKFKSLSQDTIAFFKLHRHYRCDINFISQSWEDIDVTVRRLADELWYVRRLGPFTALRRVYKSVGVDENTHQIIDKYEFGKLLPCILPFPFHRKNLVIFLRRPYYKYFDSFSKMELPIVKSTRPADKDTWLKIYRKGRRKHNKKGRG